MKNPDFTWSESSLETKLYILPFVKDIPLSFEPFLYQTADYLNATDRNEKISFYLFRNGDKTPVACIHFTNTETGFISPSRAPFGGIQCDEKCTPDELIFFLDCIKNWFSLQNNHFLKLKCAPTCYYDFKTADLLTSVYKMSGYKISETFLNHHIPVSQSPFLNGIIPAEQKRLVKCKNSGFLTYLYDSPDSAVVYNFIKKSRLANGYLMSMTFDQLNILINKFPDQCKVFVVTDKNEIIASTVTVLVCKKVLYNFLPADRPDYKNFSPMVFLMEAVYNYCQKEGISIIDLGISTDHNGVEKPGLLRFKKNLGGIESLKFSYEKKIEAALVD